MHGDGTPTPHLPILLTGAAAVAAASAALEYNNSEPAAKPHGKTKSAVREPAPAFPWDAGHLFFTVREPFPTRTCGASVVFGRVTRDQPLTLLSEMAEIGVIFSDGIEKDFLEFNAGTKAIIAPAARQGRLIV